MDLGCSAGDDAVPGGETGAAGSITAGEAGNADGGSAPGDGGTSSAGDGGPPPETEDEGDFRVPRASGRFVYSVSETTNSVAVIDSDTLAIDVVGVGRGPTDVASLDAAGTVAVLDEGSEDVAFITTADNGESTVEVVDIAPGANRLVAAPDGAHVIAYHDDAGEPIAAGSDQELTVLDTATRTPFELTVGVHPRDVVFSSAGDIAYVVTDDGVNVIPMGQLDILDKPDLIPVIDDPAISPSLVEIQVAADQATALARVQGDPRLFATDLVTTELFIFDLPSEPTDLDIADDASFAIATLPEIGGSRYAELTLPVLAGSALTIYELPDEYVGLAHLTPDAQTMLLYTTVNPYGSAAPGQEPWGYGEAPLAGGSGSSGSGSGSGSDSGTGTGTDTGMGSGSDTGDPVPPTGPDPRQRLTIVRREGGVWDEGLTLFVDQPIGSVGVAPDGASAMLVHDTGEGTGWAYTLVDLSKTFPVKKLQAVEVPPGAVLFTPDGDRGVVLLRDGGATQRIDLIDLRTFIVDALGLGSPPEGAGFVDSTSKIFVSQEHPSGRITFIDPSGGVETVTGYRLNDAVKD